jgi:thiamine phosphate synthase YjbQ (UPF0047 family)
VNGKESLLPERTSLKRSIKEEEIVKILAGVVSHDKEMKHNKTSWPDQNKHIRSPRIANFPLVKASSLDLQRSRRR